MRSLPSICCILPCAFSPPCHSRYPCFLCCLVRCLQSSLPTFFRHIPLDHSPAFERLPSRLSCGSVCPEPAKCQRAWFGFWYWQLAKRMDLLDHRLLLRLLSFLIVKIFLYFLSSSFLVLLLQLQLSRLKGRSFRCYFGGGSLHLSSALADAFASSSLANGCSLAGSLLLRQRQVDSLLDCKLYGLSIAFMPTP